MYQFYIIKKSKMYLNAIYKKIIYFIIKWNKDKVYNIKLIHIEGTL